MLPSFSSTTPLALARLVTWLVGTLVLVGVVEMLSSADGSPGALATA